MGGGGRTEGGQLPPLPPSSDAPEREEDVVSGAAKRKMWRGLTNWPLGEISTSYIDQKGQNQGL